jgi:hypothetical protein
MKVKVPKFFYSFPVVFTIDIIKQSSHAIADKLYPPSYSCIILMFISKSMAECLQYGLLFLSGAYLPPAMT